MNEARARLLEIADPALPALPAMLGPAASEILGAAVAGAGASVVECSPVQINLRPGRSATVSYDARVAWSRHNHSTERLVAVTGSRAPERAVVVENGDQRVSVFSMKDDPALPGLATAADHTLVRALLDSLDAPAGPLSVRVAAYRPCRRAVVEITGPKFRLFAKIVPPAEVEALQERHRMLAEHLPVPRSHGWSREHGLILLEAIPGDTLRHALKDRTAALPPPAEIRELLRRIPDPRDGREAQAPLAAVPVYAGLLRAVLPELAPRLTELAAALGGDSRSQQQVPVHGDLYEAQVLVRRGAISGLIDVDTVSLGQRIDDWANFTGHLAALQESAPAAVRARISAYTRRIIAAAQEDGASMPALRRRVAAVLLGLATGPFRVQSRDWPAETRSRLSLAERWLAEGDPIG